MPTETLKTIYPATSTFLPDDYLCPFFEDLPGIIEEDSRLIEAVPYLAELAEIELLAYRLRKNPPSLPENIDTWQLRPGVELLEVSWSGLPELLAGGSAAPARRHSYVLLIPPLPGKKSASPAIVSPDSGTLMALKIVVEKLDMQEIAAEHKVALSWLKNLLSRAAHDGILLQPMSKIARPENFAVGCTANGDFSTARVFTLQWHITQSCDLHCRHCYDRSNRADVSLAQGREVLDQLYEFCGENNVLGQVSFSGGNPLLHPHFFSLYREAAARGFMTAILGNPAGREELEELLSIQKPEFFQVSLEGLQPHNDYMRGRGHYDRTMTFLGLLGELDIFSMVMLTLTRANRDQVLTLAEILRNKVGLFTFNRLAMVGEGAALSSVPPDEYRGFLESYLAAAARNPIMRLKDNLFNIVLLREGGGPGGGCAGYGCGAAFNFVSLLPDGQVHACRKLPSLIGNIHQSRLDEIYHSELAAKYRSGSSGCRECRIRHVCRGCPAVSHGFGKDIFVDIDPYCFLD